MSEVERYLAGVDDELRVCGVFGRADVECLLKLVRVYREACAQIQGESSWPLVKVLARQAEAEAEKVVKGD